METTQYPARAFLASITAEQMPICVVEVRGMKVSEIKWTDKTTKQNNSMLKYLVACEFADGTQISLQQVGKDFTGLYPFERGQRYVFGLRDFTIERDAQSADFVDAAPHPASKGGLAAPVAPSK